ncbi:hypothetical protein L227DRAFT_262915 [Lentinus tigrinus ALCF2SS1-6]|uniref:Uncharacterized protein n=1 Tax=Lentinus tigrinus ALCF2SS1-6 TaxID=1328759 RepID=A0A5C2SLS6_9APHY|nr:hypothetical protein L227DRAFT_262915 [Lentinus tigrinus ALCF2SS1-6]
MAQRSCCLGQPNETQGSRRASVRSHRVDSGPSTHTWALAGKTMRGYIWTHTRTIMTRWRRNGRIHWLTGRLTVQCTSREGQFRSSKFEKAARFFEGGHYWHGMPELGARPCPFSSTVRSIRSISTPPSFLGPGSWINPSERSHPIPSHPISRLERLRSKSFLLGCGHLLILVPDGRCSTSRPSLSGAYIRVGVGMHWQHHDAPRGSLGSRHCHPCACACRCAPWQWQDESYVRRLCTHASSAWAQ